MVNLQEIYSRLKQGHHCHVQGHAGTGKSSLLRKLYELLSSDYKVQICTPTGVSARSLHPKARTIHSLFGLMDGRHDKYKLINNYKKQHMTQYRELVRDTDILIIDEVSMLSAHLFDEIEYLFRNFHGEHQLFGGTTVLLCGDVTQLPPVANISNNDHGEHVYTSNIYKLMELHVEKLIQPYRSSDGHFKIVRETSLGKDHCSPETLSCLMRRNNQLHENGSVHLFATRQEVDTYNHECLRKVEGNEQLYPGVKGSVSCLKPGVPVIVTRNLYSLNLVNGSMGIVQELGKENATVFFPDLDRPHVIKLYDEIRALTWIDISSMSNIPAKPWFGTFNDCAVSYIHFKCFQSIPEIQITVIPPFVK